MSVPPNSSADVYLPGGSATATTVYLDGRRVTATYGNGFLRVAGVQPGCHVLTTDPGGSAYRDTKLTGICPDGYRAPARHGR